MQYFQELTPARKSQVIPTLNRSQIETFSEICENFLQRKLTREPADIKKLKKYKKEIETVALKSVPLYQKKRILKSRRGGAIFSVLLPLAAGLISSLIAK